MADNVVANSGTGGATFATDEISGVHYPRTKIALGADGVNGGDVSSANPLPVNDAGGSLTVDNAALAVVGGGVEATAQRVTIASDSTGVLSVDDNGGSLTVDNAALAVVGGGVEAAALRVTIANDSTGLVSVDDNGGSLTVDGTVAATQSGVWTVQPGNTANTTAWLVTGTGGTFPVTDSGGSLTVDNPALSVVGGGLEATAQRVTIASDSTGVLSVDDNGGTLTVDDGGGSLTVDGTVAATQSGVWTVQPGNTANTTAWLVTGTGGTFPVTDSGGSLTVDNGGTFVTQENGAALTALQLIDDTVYSDDAAFTPGTSKVLAVGCQADETATDSVDEGDVGCPRMTLDRKQITVPYSHAAGGATPGKLISAATTNATSVKASAGTLYMVTAVNTNAAARYLKFYNKASAPTVGTDTPVLVFAVPGNTAGAGIVVPIPACGIAFDTGIALALTTGAADNDTGAVALNEITVSYATK